MASQKFTYSQWIDSTPSTTYPGTWQQICPACGMSYTGYYHTCPTTYPQPNTGTTTQYTNLYQLDLIMQKLDELMKRIEKIEEILDEEL